MRLHPQLCFSTHTHTVLTTVTQECHLTLYMYESENNIKMLNEIEE